VPWALPGGGAARGGGRRAARRRVGGGGCCSAAAPGAAGGGAPRSAVRPRPTPWTVLSVLACARRWRGARLAAAGGACSRGGLTMRPVVPPALVLVLLNAALTACTSAPLRPNLLLAFSDDTGWGDASCFGNPSVITPGLDRLAREGLRLTSFYVAAPICSSSRSSLLTGRIPLRTGVWSNKSTHLITFPIDSTAGMLLRERTLAEELQSAGYVTAALGKVGGCGHEIVRRRADGCCCAARPTFCSGIWGSCRSTCRPRVALAPT
jgi:hypothetical protein